MLFIHSLSCALLISTRWFDVNGRLLHNACCIYCTLWAYVFNINGLSTRKENNISQPVLLALSVCDPAETTSPLWLRTPVHHSFALDCKKTAFYASLGFSNQY